MEEYHKIETLLNRDKTTFGVIEGEWRLPEFEYLKDNQWEFTEKVDGTNIRVMWNGQALLWGGKTDNAQIPTFLLSRLQELFPPTKFVGIFPDPICLYGEGYGAKIQKGGGNYKSDGVDFILFDVKIGPWWLQDEDVQDIAEKMGIDRVPIHGVGPLESAIKVTRDGKESFFGDFIMEGFVLRPCVDLWNRMGQRVITKIKHKDRWRE